MTTLPNLTHEVPALADNDWIYVFDVSNPSDPDGKMLGSKLRPAGAKISNYLRFEGTVTIPGLAAGVEDDATISVPGAQVGDHVVFNLSANLPADLAITYVRVSAADTVLVRFRNLHASSGYGGGSPACTALVIRSIDP
ncbi:hypothetical protein MRS76_11165 [Rhizobiaceae bacterium n13]|uniref:hypothetical protein n=1 Tax=Ferirhizobium litorale TaxID=2927786 RepID=UPI0024B2AD16|nr:hypothetical protein [Fererhizobium litorale]MDI7862520.1 hypothetical protein [Fererhizobium litorale]